jgi:cytochrome P450
VRKLTTYQDARDGFRSRDLRQALYDDGHRLMTGVIVNLHGDEHLARRRLENRLFRRDTFAWYEQARIPSIIDTVLAGAIGAGRGDLLPLARRTMMTLSIDVAGVDHPLAPGRDGELDDAVFDHFYELMDRLARASTVAHAVGDKEAIMTDGDGALAAFDVEFFRPSLARRAELVERFERGVLPEEELPRDVLTTLLRNQDRLDLPPEHVLREVAYYPWVGSHSTSAQLVHAMHHVFAWIDDHAEARDELVADDLLLQRFVHESMRLHPASPVAMRVALADVTLKSGTTIAEGERVAIDVERANRDPAVFGPDADRFDPHRMPADGASPWGLSFGHGMHACLGQELAGGLEPDGLHEHLLGAVTIMAGTMLRAGARPDPDAPAALDPNTTRVMWGTYPVRFGP